jgi:NADH-quinone oxidoreductase subunit M
LLWLAFFASFAVKMPMWPVHTWLPDAHVQAPTAGSVVLAAILLKMGGYGFLRFSLPMFPVASELMQDFVFTLSVIAIVYTSLVAMVQEDMKKLIAYSSVAHMGYVTMGIFAANQQGIDGAIFQMISHGFISGALFLCVGVIYDRMHTREIDAYGGLVNRMPAYALWLYRKVVLGDLIKESLRSITDMTVRERAIFAPLVVMTLLLGVYPALVTDIIGPSVEALIAEYDLARVEGTTLHMLAQN